MSDVRRLKERYMNDPTFHTLVRSMMAGMERLAFSPGELREAAVFAEIMFWESHASPIQMYRDLERIKEPPHA